MKFFKIVKLIENDFENNKYTFLVYLFNFIPLIVICDWNDSEANKITNGEGKAWRKYYFMGFIFYTKEFKTTTQTPKLRC